MLDGPSGTVEESFLFGVDHQLTPFESLGAVTLLVYSRGGEVDAPNERSPFEIQPRGAT